MCNTVLGIRCVGVGKCQSEYSFVCFGAKPTQKAYAQNFPPEEDKGRKVRESTEVDRRDQGIKTDQSTEQGSRQKRAGARTYGLRSRFTNVRGRVSVPCGFVGISLEYTLALAHRCTESYARVSQNSPFLRLELTQVCVCFLFFHPLGCVCYVLCVRKEM